mgnify:CR=1 FL=1
MDEAVIKQIQREGADALLDIGVSVPLKAFRLPWRKTPVELRVTMKRPYIVRADSFCPDIFVDGDHQ